MTTDRVAIVGAGIAGLSAARDLALAGREVVVFDKARGVGGRTATRRQPPATFDHGAQYFTARTEAFGRQLKAWCRDGVAAPWSGRIGRLGREGVVEPSRASETASERASQRYVGIPGMSALAKHLGADVEIELRHTIERVERDTSSWRLRTRAGDAFSGFGTVIIATPAPQAVPLLDAARGLARRAAEVEMQPCWAVMATFAEPLATDLDAAFVTDSPVAWIARNASKPGRPASESWVLHATSMWSARHLEDPGETIVMGLLQALANALGGPLPRACETVAHRWRFARAATPSNQALWSPDERIGACGDWTHGDRVEDAFNSGAAIAKRLLEGV